MKFLVLLSAVLVFSELHGAESDWWPLEGKDMICSKYELKIVENGQIQCQIMCQNHKEFDCVGILFSSMKRLAHYCGLCKDDVLKDVAVNGFGFYRNVENACEKFNGIFGIRSEKGVCCSRRCPKCGGKDCGKWKDTSMTMDNGKTLGADKCCKWKIIKQGKKCGSNGREAPCML